MELSSSNITIFFIFSQKRTFVIYWEMEPPPKNIPYISGNGSPKKTFYISGSNFPSLKNEKKPVLKSFLYFKREQGLKIKNFLYFSLQKKQNFLN